MLMRLMMATLVGSTLIPAALAQTRDADMPTLRDILAEIRAIHEDMRITETTQLLVAELEMQQGVVNRATENADGARAKLSDLHLDQKHLEAVCRIPRSISTRLRTQTSGMLSPTRSTAENRTWPN